MGGGVSHWAENPRGLNSARKEKSFCPDPCLQPKLQLLLPPHPGHRLETSSFLKVLTFCPNTSPRQCPQRVPSLPRQPQAEVTMAAVSSWLWI